MAARLHQGVLVALLIGCTGDSGDDSALAEPQIDVSYPERAPLPGETDCVVTVTTGLPEEGSSHVDVCTPVDYESNPPSSGDHWGIWAAYASYTAPVPREMLVHDLEHGAVLMLYDCDTDCPDIVAALEQVRAGFPTDTACGGGPSRFVIAPDPALDEPIGLAAWRATYVATCIDPDSLAAFAAARYDHGPELMCGGGADPATVDCAEQERSGP